MLALEKRCRHMGFWFSLEALVVAPNPTAVFNTPGFDVADRQFHPVNNIIGCASALQLRHGNERRRLGAADCHIGQRQRRAAANRNY